MGLDEKVFVVDLSKFRFGYLVKQDKFRNLDNVHYFVYRPVNKVFGTREITNVPTYGWVELTSSDVGGVSDFSKFVVIFQSEGQSSFFLDEIMRGKYNQLIQQLLKTKKELEIKKGVEFSRRYQYSKDILKITDEYDRVRKILEKKERPFRGGY